MRGLNIALVLVVVCSCPVGISHAQSCVDPSNLCDQWWDSSTSRWIQNPTCTFINHAYLQSDRTAANPSDGVAVNPYGQHCGTEKNGTACGVRTTTNTCAESAPPVYCDPYSNYDCCFDPYDPTCGLGGGGGDICGPEDPCYYGAQLDVQRSPLAPPGNASVAAALRKAVLASPLPKSESALLRALSRANGIYLKARFTLSQDGAKQTASYEYWERADRYRIRLGPGLDFPWPDIAFDGKFLQGQGGEDLVEIRRGDDRSTPLPDGPLALALASLRVNDATECRLCQLRLADLKQWRSEAVARPAAAEAVIGTGTFDSGALRTGESDAEGRLVRLTWPPDAADSSQGFEVRLGDYQPLAGTDAVFPMRLTARLTPQTSVEYVVEKIELSPTIGEEVFDLHSKARKVLYGVIDRNGSWHGNYVRYQPTPGAPCNTTGDTHKQ